MRYQKNYLTKVILRVDFAPIAALMGDKRTPFSDDLSADFPVITPTQGTTISLTFGPNGSAFQQGQRGWQWSHATQDNLRVVALAPDSLTIEYGKGQYEYFVDFRATIERVFSAFTTRFGVTEITRIGLRYIDEITMNAEGGPLSWDGIIAPALVDGVRAGLVPGLDLTRSMHQLVAVKGDLGVAFNYGIYNPDFPSPVAQRHFVLDYDIYTSGAIGSADVLRTIDEMNVLSEQMFESSIEQRLREDMVIVPHE